MRCSKLSCRRLLKCDRCSSTDRCEGWPFFGGQLWWSNGSVLSLSYSCLGTEKGHFLREYWVFLWNTELRQQLSYLWNVLSFLKPMDSTRWFCIYAFTEVSELVSQVYFFLWSCCTFGDTFKSTGYAVLTDLGMLFLLVGKPTGLRLLLLILLELIIILGVHIKGSKTREGIACSINPTSKSQLAPMFKNKQKVQSKLVSLWKWKCSEVFCKYCLGYSCSN